MSVTYCDDHASLSLPSDNHHHYGLDDLTNWSTINNVSISDGTTLNSANYYNTYIRLWNTNPIEVIKYNDEGVLTVHKKLVDAIVNMITDNDELREKLLSMLMEQLIQKSKKLSINTSDLEKTFE